MILNYLIEGIFFSNHSIDSTSEPKVISSPVIQQSEQYRGFGDTSSSSSSQNTSGKMFDPFESFRRNKGQAYIQRIRDARRD